MRRAIDEPGGTFWYCGAQKHSKLPQIGVVYPGATGAFASWIAIILGV
jgi:hypothetical protein